MAAPFPLAPGWAWERGDRARAHRNQSFSSSSNLQSASVVSAPQILAALGREDFLKNLGPGEGREFQAILREKDPEMVLEAWLAFGMRLEEAGKAERAAELYAAMGAKQRLDALMGRGSTGLRAEVLIRNFTKTATDHRVILPMFGASVLGRSVASLTLSRLAATPRAHWFSRGIGARIGAGTGAFLTELTTFAALGRALAPHSEGPFADDLKRSALTLGALKLAGWGAGKLHPNPWLSQGGTFVGLLASHKLEVQLGLRPDSEGASTVTDSLATMLSLGVGSSLGSRFLGPGWQRWVAELEARNRLSPDRPFGRPWETPLSKPLTWAAEGPGMGALSSSKPPLQPARALVLESRIKGNGNGSDKAEETPLTLEEIDAYLMGQLLEDPKAQRIYLGLSPLAKKGLYVLLATKGEYKKYHLDTKEDFVSLISHFLNNRALSRFQGGAQIILEKIALLYQFDVKHLGSGFVPGTRDRKFLSEEASRLRSLLAEYDEGLWRAANTDASQVELAPGYPIDWSKLSDLEGKILSTILPQLPQDLQDSFARQTHTEVDLAVHRDLQGKRFSRIVEVKTNGHPHGEERAKDLLQALRHARLVHQHGLEGIEYAFRDRSIHPDLVRALVEIFEGSGTPFLIRQHYDSHNRIWTGKLSYQARNLPIPKSLSRPLPTAARARPQEIRKEEEPGLPWTKEMADLLNHVMSEFAVKFDKVPDIETFATLALKNLRFFDQTRVADRIETYLEVHPNPNGEQAREFLVEFRRRRSNTLSTPASHLLVKIAAVLTGQALPPSGTPRPPGPLALDPWANFILEIPTIEGALRGRLHELIENIKNTEMLFEEVAGSTSTQDLTYVTEVLNEGLSPGTPIYKLGEGVELNLRQILSASRSTSGLNWNRDLIRRLEDGIRHFDSLSQKIEGFRAELEKNGFKPVSQFQAGTPSLVPSAENENPKEVDYYEFQPWEGNAATKLPTGEEVSAWEEYFIRGQYPEMELVVPEELRVQEAAQGSQPRADLAGPVGRPLLRMMALWVKYREQAPSGLRETLDFLILEIQSSVATETPRDIVRKGFEAYRAFRGEFLDAIPLLERTGLAYHLRGNEGPPLPPEEAGRKVMNYLSQEMIISLHQEEILGLIQKVLGEGPDKLVPAMQERAAEFLGENSLRLRSKGYLAAYHHGEPIPDPESYPKLPEFPEIPLAAAQEETDWVESLLQRDPNFPRYSETEQRRVREFWRQEILRPLVQFHALHQLYLRDVPPHSPTGRALGQIESEFRYYSAWSAGGALPTHLAFGALGKFPKLYVPIRRSLLGHMGKKLAPFQVLKLFAEWPALEENVTGNWRREIGGNNPFLLKEFEAAAHVAKLIRLKRADAMGKEEWERTLWDFQAPQNFDTPDELRRKIAEHHDRILHSALQDLTLAVVKDATPGPVNGKGREEEISRWWEMRYVPGRTPAEVGGKALNLVELLSLDPFAFWAEIEEFSGRRRSLVVPEVMKTKWENESHQGHLVIRRVQAVNIPFYNMKEIFKSIQPDWVRQIFWMAEEAERVGNQKLIRELERDMDRATALLLMGLDPSYVGEMFELRVFRRYQDAREKVLEQTPWAEWGRSLPELKGLQIRNLAKEYETTVRNAHAIYRDFGSLSEKGDLDTLLANIEVYYRILEILHDGRITQDIVNSYNTWALPHFKTFEKSFYRDYSMRSWTTMYDSFVEFSNKISRVYLENRSVILRSLDLLPTSERR